MKNSTIPISLSKYAERQITTKIVLNKFNSKNH